MRSDGSVTDQPSQDPVAVLGRVGVFQQVSPLLLHDVARLMQPLRLAAGQVAVTEGDPADALYIIEDGTLSVMTGSRPVARLGPGEFFGEIALLTGGPRTATVRAETDAALWRIPAPAFTGLLQAQPALAEAVSRAGGLRQRALGAQEYAIERTNLATLLTGQELRIGRAADNDLVLDSRVVSAHHARLQRVGDDVVITDLGSSNGTFVNGAEVVSARLKDGDQIWIADQRLVFDRRDLAHVVEPKGIRIDAAGLRQVVKGGKNLLADIDLTILPGEFVAIVGGSGAGKSTLMDALSGVRPASGGVVRYNGEDFYPRRALYTHSLGYVPQDDIIHRDLPLRVTLDYAARLRLPGDTPPAERRAAVDAAISQLGLTEQRDVFVNRLSGGQRKRASIGVELLTEPRIFFLDEPTSGLDPATDASMMRLLRDLTRTGSTVVLTTHATKNVALCDKVVFLAKGGHLAFVGSPQRALEYFNTQAFDEIYELLETERPEDWGQRFRASTDHRRLKEAQQGMLDAGAEAPRVQLPRGQRGVRLRVRQWLVTSRRNAELYLRNRQRTIPLLVQPLVFTLLLIALFRTGLFAPTQENLSAPTQMVFIFTFSVLLFGLLWGVQEIVSEIAIFRRERLVNLGVAPYLLSKMAVLVPIMALGITVMTVLLALTDRLPSGGILELYAPLWLTLFLTGLVGLQMSLFTSAIAGSPQVASDLIAVWIMPQVLFSGALFPVPEMALPGRLLSIVMPLRWAFEGSGHVIDLNGFYAVSSSPTAQSLVMQFDDTFSRAIWQNWVILGGIVVLFYTATVLVLRGKTRS